MKWDFLLKSSFFYALIVHHIRIRDHNILFCFYIFSFNKKENYLFQNFN